MKIRIRADSVEVEGYVNAVERKSNPLMSRMGTFVELIRKGAFKRSLEREDDVRLLLNHDPLRDLGGTANGNFELSEDSIGLKARATITDKEVIEKARNGKLVGWSFGFLDRDVENKRDEDGVPLRVVKDMDLKEVSLLDTEKTPAYDGTLVSVRSDETALFFGSPYEDEIQIREDKPDDEGEKDVPKQQETVDKPINYEQWDKLIADMKA